LAETQPQDGRVPWALVERAGGVALVVGLCVAGNALMLWLLRGGTRPVVFVAVGAVLAVLGVAAQHRRLAALARSPAFALTLIVAGAAVLGLAALALVSVINARHYRRIDLTGSELYTLDPQTVGILQQVDRPLHIISAMVPHPKPRNAIERFNNLVRSRAEAMLREFASHSRFAEFTALDLYADPQSRQRLEERHQISLLRDSVVFVYQEPEVGRRVLGVEFRQLAAFSTMPDVPPKFRGEAVFTAALLSLVEGRRSRVCFVSEHGERSIDEFGRLGLSDLAEMLRADNCAVQACTLPDMAGDCDVLVIAGPRRAFRETELDALRTYLKDGGSLIALLDPVVGDMRPSGVEDVLADHGITAATDLVIVEQSRLRMVGRTLGSTPTVRIDTADYPEAGSGPERALHPIVRDLAGIRTSFYVACPVSAAASADGQKDPLTSELVRTSPRSGGKRGFDPARLDSLRVDPKKDARGPFSIAVARGRWQADEGEATAGRIVVFGDADFVTNTYLKQGETGNLALIRSAVGWAAGREYKVGIPPKPLELERRLDAAEWKKDLARWATVFAPPFHILLVGLVVWWVRRR